jgi:hypothetical protein
MNCDGLKRADNVVLPMTAHTNISRHTHCELIRRDAQIPASPELQICPTFHRHLHNLTLWVNHTQSGDVGATMLVWL